MFSEIFSERENIIITLPANVCLTLQLTITDTDVNNFIYVITLYIVEEKYALFNAIYFLKLLMMINNVKK